MGLTFESICQHCLESICQHNLYLLSGLWLHRLVIA